MAPAYSQSGTLASFSAVASVDVALPATVSDNDFALLVLSSTIDRIPEFPGDWTAFGDVVEQGATFKPRTAWKRLASSDGGTTATVTFGILGTGCARIFTFSGVITSDPAFEGDPISFNALTKEHADGTDLTPSVDDELVVNLWTFAADNASTPDTGWTERSDAGGNGCRIVVDDQLGTQGNTVTAAVRDISGSDTDSVVWTLGLLPGSATVTAVLDAPLGSASASATATVKHPSTLSAPLGALAGALAATVKHSNVATAPLGRWDSTAGAIISHPTTFAAPLAGLSGSIAATVAVPATLAAPLGPLAATAALVAEVHAVFNADAGALVASASAHIVRNATLSAPLGAISASASATVRVVATLNANLGGLVATFSANSSVVLQANLGGLQASSTATVQVLAALVADLGRLVGSLRAGPGIFLTANLGPFAASMAATVRAHARKIELLPGPYSSVLDFNPRRARAQVGDRVLFQLTLADAGGPIDLSSAAVLEIALENPRGELFVHRASAGSQLGRVEYQAAANELDLAGDWKVQARAIRAGGGEVRTTPRAFVVGWNLPIV